MRAVGMQREAWCKCSVMLSAVRATCQCAAAACEYVVFGCLLGASCQLSRSCSPVSLISNDSESPMHKVNPMKFELVSMLVCKLYDTSVYV